MKDSNEKYIPNPKLHCFISLVKSAFRIVAGIALCFGSFFVSGGLLVIAEILGVVEELV